MREKPINIDADKVLKDIRKLLLNALTQKGWYFFENPHLCKCWEEMKCKRTQCPSYKSLNLRCWQVSGTFCNGKPQGVFARKMGDCYKCRVYKKATQGDIVLKFGEDFNNLMFQLKNKEDELRRIIRHSEEKNRELGELNVKINRLLKKLDIKNLQLRDLSMKDGLTGLYNYRFFIKSLREHYKLAKRYVFPLSCIMIDIDYFKAVNDTYGHQVGDMILKQLADILRKNVRDTDEVVRYGGEEFVVLFPHTNSDDAYVKAERLRNLVSDHNFRAGSRTLNITVSIGLSNYPSDKKIDRAESLINFSDKALYQAKEGGRNRTVIYSDGRVLKGRRPVREKEILERRRHPRVQTLIKVECAQDDKELSYCNAVDISFSGLSLMSRERTEINRILNIRMYLPAACGKKGGMTAIDVRGLVVRCREVEGFLHRGAGRRHDTKNYMIGVQFVRISKKDSICLQKYFVSMFKNRKAAGD
ncbi:MAG: diguanylate cyclase [Nitrospirota bacterium]|nr:diguanylate cyclase [Nitrospirota bacterium]